MSIINHYNSPTVINWNLDENGKQVSLPIVNETKQVVDGKIPLEGLPDEQFRVQINGYVEIDMREKIDAPNKFKCDYTHGVLYFDQSKSGANINVNKYYSRGQFYMPASRIWTSIDDFGNVVGTLDKAIDRIPEIIDVTNNISSTITEGRTTDKSIKDSISVANTTKSKLDASNNVANTSKVQLDESINVANATKTSLDKSTDSAISEKSAIDRATAFGTTLKVGLDNNISTGVPLKEQLDKSIAQGEQLQINLPPLVSESNASKIELDSSIAIANTVNNKLTGSINVGQANISEVVDIMNNSTLLYRPAVANYSQLTVKYPLAERGFFANTLDTKKWYRFDGKEWIHISTFDGTDFDSIFNYAKYVWIEEIAVPSGSLTFTLKSKVGALDKLIIKDTKYQAEWLEGIHWTRVAQTVKFTENGGIAENLTFRVTNIGKDLKLEVDDSKTTLDEHTNNKKVELNSHTTVKKGEIDSHTASKKAELDDTISTANTTKVKLDNSIGSAESINNIISSPTTGTIKKANDKNTELLSTISKSTTNKSNLDISIGNANSANDILSNPTTGTISKASNKNTELQNIIATANARKSALDTSITNADSKKAEIDNLATLKKSEITSHTDTKKVEIASYTDTKKAELNVYTNSKKSEIDNHWSNKVKRETGTVSLGSNSFTLSNQVGTNDRILIFDNKYGVKWVEKKHWNRSGQVITFTSLMLETMEFDVINLG